MPPKNFLSKNFHGYHSIVMDIIRRSYKGSHVTQVVEWLANHLLFDVIDVNKPFWGTSSNMATNEMHFFQKLQIDYVHVGWYVPSLYLF
jgi:hypothetical protein